MQFLRIEQMYGEVSFRDMQLSWPVEQSMPPEFFFRPPPSALRRSASDFHGLLSIVVGPPPSFLWMENCGTSGGHRRPDLRTLAALVVEEDQTAANQVHARRLAEGARKRRVGSSHRHARGIQ